MANVRLSHGEIEALRSVRDGKPVLLSQKQYLRFLRMSLIRGAISGPALTVVGAERIARAEVNLERLQSEKTD